MFFDLSQLLDQRRKSKISTSDFVLAFISLLVILYIFFDYEGLVYRQGILAKIEFGSFIIPYELIIGATWNCFIIRRPLAEQ